MNTTNEAMEANADHFRILGQFVRGERNKVGDHWAPSMANEAFAAIAADYATLQATVERLNADLAGLRARCEGLVAQMADADFIYFAEEIRKAVHGENPAPP